MKSIELKEKRDNLVKEKNSLFDKIEAIDKTAKTESRNLKEDEEKTVSDSQARVAEIRNSIKDLDSKIENAEAYEAEQADRAKAVKKDQRSGEQKELDNVSTKFSIGRAMQAILNNKEFTGAEREISEEGAKELRDSGMYPKGFAIPRSILDNVEKRTDIDQNTAGMQSTDLDGYARAIRENAIYNKVGINFRKAVGDVKTNIITGMNWAWVSAENTAAADIGANPTNVTATPKWGRGYVDVSKTLLAQNPDAMGEFMFDLGAAEATFFDTALFSSSTVSNAPTAIAATSNVLTFTEAASYSANASIYSDFIEAIQTLGANDTMTQNLKFVASSTLFSDLFKSPGVASVTTGMNGQAYYGQTVAGFPTIFSNYPTSATTAADVIAGDFSMGVKAYQWGGLDLFLDPYSVSLNDQVRIVGHKRVSWVVPQPTKFVKFSSLFA